jgi:hypothetical protein
MRGEGRRRWVNKIKKAYSRSESDERKVCFAFVVVGLRR